jgi:dolichol-phosphate mannosyltransferase
VIAELGRRLGEAMALLDGPSEAILVDDGSRDRSRERMLQLHRADPRFKIVALSRNFGHQVAVSAGLDHASGDAVVVMDADLQDPPELVPEMARLWREGYDVVYGVREDRSTDSWFKRRSAGLFYAVLRRLTEFDIPANVGDFRLVDRRALDAVRSMRERSRFLRGMFTWVGFRQTGVPYRRSERHAGETKYPLRKMVNFAIDGVVNFSQVPLRLALNAGFLFALLAFTLGFAAIIAKLAGAFTIPGWASLTVAVCFLGGLQLMMIGVLGEYIGRIYDEVKSRPLYLVAERHGMASAVPMEEVAGVPPVEVAPDR